MKGASSLRPSSLFNKSVVACVTLDFKNTFSVGLNIAHLEVSMLTNMKLQISAINSVALVRTRTIPTERPPPVGEISANFCG